jgi:phosphocarrier protein HPr
MKTSSALFTRLVRVGGRDGLNLHAASLLSQRARSFPCDIRVSCGDRHADAKSVWELMCLVAEPGCDLLLEAAGPESEEALSCLEKVVAC